MTASLIDPRAGAPRTAASGWSRPGLPGLAGRGRPPGRVPHDLLAPGILLLAGAEPGRTLTLAEHARLWGPTPAMGLDDLIARVAAQDVVGAGGAEFPTHRKLESLAGSRVSMVIVNGCEGETASGKDGVLLTHVPHLVLDGAVTAARALGAPRIVVRISAERTDLAALLPLALAERSDGIPIELSVGPASFVAGEATAVIRAVTGGPALPRDLGLPPVAPTRFGRRSAHVLLSNAETFGRVGVAVRGESGESALASASGAVRFPGVMELPTAKTLADLARAAGGLLGDPRVLVSGGWHGRWVPWDAAAAGAGLSRGSLTALGGRWGAGAFVWIPEDLPVWQALAAVARELAAGTAGQCGPCWRGLPAVSRCIGEIAAGRDTSAAERTEELERLLTQVDGRGICAHPSAAVAALRSALLLIGQEG